MPVRDIETDSGERRELRATTLPGLRWMEMLDHLWRERRRILKWTALGLVISLVLAYFVPKYEATVQIMPSDTGAGSAGLLALAGMSAGPNVPGLGSLGDLLGVTTKTPSALYVKVLQSESVERALVDRFDLRKYYGKRYYEDAEGKLDSHTKVLEDKKSGVISISVKEPDAKMAQDIANGYVDELNKVLARVSTSAAGREREFIEKRLSEEKVALQDAEKNFSEFASTNMAPDVPTQTRVMVETSARLQGELVAARAQLQGLEQIYTPDSTRVKTLQGQIGALERQLKQMNTGGPASNDPTNPYPSVKTLPSLGVQWADLYREQKVHETVYEYLTSQYESARIREAKDIATVKVLDRVDRLPEKRHPRPWMIVVAGTFAFFVLACLGAETRRLWEAWDIDDPRRMWLARVYHRGRTRLEPTLERLPWRRNGHDRLNNDLGPKD